MSNDEVDSALTIPAEKITAKAGRSARTKIRRHPERARPEMAEDILRAGRVAHIGFAVEGQPFVIPQTYLYEDGVIYIHAAPASRMQKMLRAGTPVCVEVTLLDGLVASRNAKSHSLNYRSVVVFGHAEVVQDPTLKRAIFERMTLRYFPGRTAGVDYIPAKENDLRTADLHAIVIEELNAKVRSGQPLGTDDGNNSAPGSSYVLMLSGIDS